jgi:hypothetical protein
MAFCERIVNFPRSWPSHAIEPCVSLDRHCHGPGRLREAEPLRVGLKCRSNRDYSLAYSARSLKRVVVELYCRNVRIGSFAHSGGNS